MGKEYYIYILLDQRHVGLWKYKNLEFKYKPFYIGKGCGRRLKGHFYESVLRANTPKNNTIKKIKNELGELPIHYRIFENLSEKKAFELEKKLIKHFGKLNDGGILTNMTDGGEGHSGYHVPKPYKRRKIYQYDLNGIFIKEWESIASLKNVFNSIGNISTAVKRNGTAFGFIWSYNFVEKMPQKIKYQMPIKYTNIKQIDINTEEVIKIFDNALLIEKELNLREGARNKIYDCLNNRLKTAYGYKWKI